MFTTNFDDLINEAFYQFSNIRPTLCAHDSSIKSISIAAKRPKIIKIHGDYLFDDIKSTLKETESLEQNTKEKLMEFCKEFGLIVVGYSGSDRSVMDVLDFLTKQENYLTNGVYWCMRKDDQISLNVRNLLWREKVYPVLIDGFDELFAEMHKKLAKEHLNLKPNKEDSRVQKAIEWITKDSYNLKRNESIKSDLEAIDKDLYSQDLSRFISDLSKNNETRSLSFTDMRNLLEIESLEQRKKIKEAHDLCEAFYEKAKDEDAKKQYIHKLIELSSTLSRKEECLRLCQKLIETDHKSLQYKTLQMQFLESYEEKYRFVLNLLKDNKYDYSLYNEAAKIATNLLKQKPNSNLTSYKQVIEWLDTSIKLDPSLDNPAWRRKFSALKSDLKSDKEEKNENPQKETIEELIKAATQCNPEHYTTLTLQVDKAIFSDDYSYAKNLKKDLYDFLEKASKPNRKNLILMINGLISAFPEMSNNDGFKVEMKDFYETIIRDKEIERMSAILIDKAQYYIGQENNLDKARDYLRQAIACDDIAQYLEEALEAAKNIDIDMIEAIHKEIEARKSELSSIEYLKLKSEYHLRNKNYEQAREYMEKAYNEGLSFEGYVVTMTYLLLKEKKYEETINFVESHPALLSDKKIEAALMNYHFAAKQIGSKKYNEVEVRNFSAQSTSNSVKICAFIIINDIAAAKRLIKKELQKNYGKINQFKEWPIVPQSVLNDLDFDAIKSAA